VHRLTWRCSPLVDHVMFATKLTKFTLTGTAVCRLGMLTTIPTAPVSIQTCCRTQRTGLVCRQRQYPSMVPYVESDNSLRSDEQGAAAGELNKRPGWSRGNQAFGLASEVALGLLSSLPIK
jgi:hypothetical protein